VLEFVLCDAVRLYEQLRELEEKRDAVLQEVQAMGTPEQERERLLKQVKEDNIEIASVDRQYGDIYQFYHLFLSVDVAFIFGLQWPYMVKFRYGKVDYIDLDIMYIYSIREH